MQWIKQINNCHVYSNFLDTQYSCTIPILDDGEQELPKLQKYIHSWHSWLPMKMSWLQILFVTWVVTLKILHYYYLTKSASKYQELFL
jgi:hypothetical protein